MNRDLIAKILDLCGYGDAAPGATVRRIAAEIRAALDPKQEDAPPPVWRWDGNDLRVNDDLFGYVEAGPEPGMWTARVCIGRARVVDDERTARALLVAVAGYDPGAIFSLSLRPDWTREGIDAVRDADLGSVIAPMLEGYAEGYDDPQCSDDPEIAREWWAGGYRALNLTTLDPDDDCPF